MAVEQSARKARDRRPRPARSDLDLAPHRIVGFQCFTRSVATLSLGQRKGQGCPRACQFGEKVVSQARSCGTALDPPESTPASRWRSAPPCSSVRVVSVLAAFASDRAHHRAPSERLARVEDTHDEGRARAESDRCSPPRPARLETDGFQKHRGRRSRSRPLGGAPGIARVRTAAHGQRRSSPRR
jgi:hypothetical protein